MTNPEDNPVKRVVKLSTTSRPPVLQLVCPGCRAVRKCHSVGTAVIAKRRREVVRCAAADCQLTWVPERGHVPAAPPAA